MSPKRKGAIAVSAVATPRRIAAASRSAVDGKEGSADIPLTTKTSLNIDDAIYDRAIAFKRSVRRTAKRRMSDIVNTALDEYLKRQGF